MSKAGNRPSWQKKTVGVIRLLGFIGWEGKNAFKNHDPATDNGLDLCTCSSRWRVLFRVLLKQCFLPVKSTGRGAFVRGH